MSLLLLLLLQLCPRGSFEQTGKQKAHSTASTVAPSPSAAAAAVWPPWVASTRKKWRRCSRAKGCSTAATAAAAALAFVPSLSLTRSLPLLLLVLLPKKAIHHCIITSTVHSALHNWHLLPDHYCHDHHHHVTRQLMPAKLCWLIGSWHTTTTNR